MRKRKTAEVSEQVVQEYVAAMSDLVRDERFAKFIDAIRTDRETCVLELSRFDVVEDARKTCALIGTIGAYTDIIGRYDLALDNIRAQKEAEEAPQ